MRACPTCGHRDFRRLLREGLWERSILPLFRVFPWECRFCQRKVYIWNRRGGDPAHHA